MGATPRTIELQADMQIGDIFEIHTPGGGGYGKLSEGA